MILRWLTKPEPIFFRDCFAWLPVVAWDDYTQGKALIWLRRYRIHADGKVTFSSFGF